MRLVEEKLREYRDTKGYDKPRKEKIEQTIAASKQAFYESEKGQQSAYFEFLFQQAGYIRKRWWVLQICVLGILWWLLVSADSSFMVKKSMGVFASMFVILMIPELWKNRSSDSMEIEGAAYYSLRQIYAARMLLFAMTDLILLSIFLGIVSLTVQITLIEFMIQFFLPLNVTCCICFEILGSRRFVSEYFAVALSILWSAIWGFIVLTDTIYQAVSMPVWFAMIIFSLCGLGYGVRKTLKSCETIWEGGLLWN